jgi:pimeloyl-ACP methyl ester carboxylesterase
MSLLNRSKDRITPLDIKKIPVTFGSHGLKIKGSVLLPAGATAESPVPGAVLCHGFGSSRKSTESAAHELVNKGVATLIFDFRGHGASDGAVDGRMPDDVVDAWNVLKACPEVNEKRMCLVGHSLGAMSAIMAAGRVDNLNALIALSCPPQMNTIPQSEIPANIGRWGKESRNIMEYPRQGSFPWMKGLSAFLSRMWMYFHGFHVRIDVRKFIDTVMDIRMTDILQELENCQKLFVFCEGDAITPYHKTVPVYEAASYPRERLIIKGGSHSLPLHPSSLRSQWIDWTVSALNNR